MDRLIKSAALLLPVALLLGACDSNTTGTGEARISLGLTDAPGDMVASWVTIDRIYLQPGSDEEADGVGDMDGRGLGRVDLMTDDWTGNLLTLADDIEGLVDDVPVPAGYYEQLRVVVTEACIAVEGDTEGEYSYYATSGFDPNLVAPEDADMAGPCATEGAGRLQTPSFAHSGIKVKFPGEGFDVTEGDHYLLLDFDAAESFGHKAGNSGMWVMHPVIWASDVDLSGTITVNLTADDAVEFPEVAEGHVLELGDFVANLSSETADAAFTDEDGDGTYTAVFPYLVPADVVDAVVSIEVPDLTGYEFTFDPATATVSLGSGEDLVLDFTLTGIAATE